MFGTIVNHPVTTKLNYSQAFTVGKDIWVWTNQDRNSLDSARGVLDELKEAGDVYRKALASKDRTALVGGSYVGVNQANARYNGVLNSICSFFSMCFSQGTDKDTYWSAAEVRSLFSALGESDAVKVLRQACGLIERYILDAESRGECI